MAKRTLDPVAVNKALWFYRIASWLTGLFLLLLVVLMVFRYGFSADIYFGGEHSGFWLGTPRESAEGINLSTWILVVHGWFYVVFLIADFRLWSLMRWPFFWLVLVAFGGVVPFLSFIVEFFAHRKAVRELNQQEQQRAS